MMELLDICELIVDCEHKTAPTQAFGYPSIRTPNIGPGYFLLDGVNRVSEETYQEWTKRAVPSPGDLIMAREAPVGNVAIIPVGLRPCLGQRTLLIRLNRNKAEPAFVNYLLNGPEIQALIRAKTNGATVPHLNMKDVRAMHLPELPPLPVQRRIAGILSAYDELIENSQRRIRILEEMARALYREWFVHFRFPGHEQTKLVDSPLGPIPQGWEVKKLADVAEVNRAQINARTAPEELHYIDISSVSPGQIDSVTTYAFADAPGRARRVVQHGDVLWSCVRPNRRSHAQVMHPEADTIASTGFAVLTATKVPFTFLYFATTTDDFVAFLTNNATGAAYPAVTAATFEKADLLIPPAQLLKQFGATSIPVAEQIHQLHRQIQTLRQTRDLLLPRLLAGQVDLAVEETAADAARSAATAVPAAPPVAPRPSPLPEKRTTAAPVGADEPEERPPAIDATDRTEVLCVIRQVFSEGGERDRDTALRDIATALGYQRLGARIREVLTNDLTTAVRRGIIESDNGTYKIRFRSVDDCTRESLKEAFESAIGRGWIEREKAIRTFARWAGYARTGEVIEQTARSLINGLLRENRLESDGPRIRRV